MFKALAWKELREMRGIALLGLAAYGWLFCFACLQVSRWHPDGVPFISDGFIEIYCWVSAGLAIAIGLRQSLGESVGGTYPFLFHRPATRRWMIGMKLLIGAVLYLLLAALPIVAYGLWAGLPGLHASPFFWATSVPSWVACFAMAIPYFGAFLTGIWPGRWFRTRLLPLLGALLASGSAPLLFVDFGSLWALASIATIDVWLVATIQYVAQTRDYS
jgi:hypothetical protein